MDFVKSLFSLCQNEEKIVQPFHSVTTKAFVQASGFAWCKKCSCQGPHSELLFPTLSAQTHSCTGMEGHESCHSTETLLGWAVWGEQAVGGPWGRGSSIPVLLDLFVSLPCAPGHLHLCPGTHSAAGCSTLRAQKKFRHPRSFWKTPFHFTEITLLF